MDPTSLLRAMDGADAVVSTAAGYTRHSKGDTAEIDRPATGNLADAARRTGIRRFVLTSILTCDQTPQVPHFWHKKLAEDRLEELGVPFVSLRPGAFLDQVTGWAVTHSPSGDSCGLVLRRSPYLCAHLGSGRLPGRTRWTHQVWTGSALTSAGIGR